jgi:CarboxypepD_reg-like domain/TonB-dependent Receptor Plug Domain
MRGVSLMLLLLATVSASDAIAQTESRPGLLRGRVLDSLTRLPIAGATIEVSERGLRQSTDSSGRFMLGALAPGQYVLHARHVGYQEAIDTLRIQEGENAERGLVLRRVPVMLEETVVSGRVVKFSPFYAAAYKRAAGGRGSFITREDVEESNANDYQTLLNRIPGVSANDRGVVFQRCQSGLEVLSDPNLKPKVQVLIDGVHTAAVADPSGVYDALRMVKPQSIQIMEVYPGVSTIPAEFLSDACAVIVIWTKRY